MLTKDQIKELIAAWEKVEELKEHYHCVEITLTDSRIDNMVFIAGDKGLNALLARVTYEEENYPERNAIAVKIVIPLEGWVAVYKDGSSVVYSSLKEAQVANPHATKFIHMREVRQ